MGRGLQSAVSVLLVYSSLLEAQPTASIAGTKPSAVQSVKVQSLEGTTKTVIQVAGAIDYRSDRIENPARIFVDLQNTTPAIVPRGEGGFSRGMQAIAVGDKLLRQVRLAENQRGVTRLVFDLAKNDVEYSVSVLSGPNRLVVEFRTVGKAGALRNPLAEPTSAVPLVSTRVINTPLEPSKQSRRAAASTAATKIPSRSQIPVQTPAQGYLFPDPPLIKATLRLPKLAPVALPSRSVTSLYNNLSGTGKVPVPYLPQSARGKVEVSIEKPLSQNESPAIAASRLSAGKQSLTRVLGLKVGRVVIDAGHGGHDVGSVGPTGLTEKEVVLDIAKRLGVMIEERLGSEVVYTREGDSFIPLEQRPEIANRSRADLFLSIHANSSPAQSVTGVETYYLNFTSSPEALEVAARENATSERSVSDLGELIKKIALKDKLDESREFAGKVQSAMFASASRTGSKTRDRGVRKAPFVVLIGAAMPSILAEVGFLSNPREEAQLRKPEYRQKIAEALFKGVSQYASTLSHFSMARTVFPGDN